MKLPRKTKDLTTIKESHRDLFTEKKDKDGNPEWVLSEIDNHDDYNIVRTVNGEAAALRIENKKFKEQQAVFEGLDLDKYTATLTENEALKAEKAALGTKDQKLIDTAVEARLKQVTSPLENKLKTYDTQMATLKTENEQLKTGQKTRTIDDAALSAFIEVGVEKHVYARGKHDDEPDGLSWARRNAVLTDDGKVIHKASGLPLKDALVNMRDDGDRPHWFGGSAGTGSGPGVGGGNVSNPWAAETWNADKQCEIQMKDEGRAKQLAASAGVDVNAAYHPKNGLPAFSQY